MFGRAGFGTESVKMTMKQLMKLSEYATHRGVSRPYVSKLHKGGLLTMRGKLVDVRATDAVLDDRVPRPGKSGESFAAARTRREAASATLRELEVAIKSHKLTDAEEVKAATEARFREDAQAFLDWPSRVAAEMAAELGIEERFLHTALDRAVRQFMRERSATPVPGEVKLTEGVKP
jgi:hypothetical protein